MKSINLVDIEKSDVKYKITKFPDGEPQIFLDSELDRKKEYEVICRITNPEELFIVLQVGDILDRHEVDWNLNILYLMSMRMDRVMSFNRPFSLKIIANALNTMNWKCLESHELHSDKLYTLLKDRSVFPKDWYDKFNSIIDSSDVIVFPDEGAYLRYTYFFTTDQICIKFIKERDVNTGKIKGFTLMDRKYVFKPGTTFVLIDDLCDGGGTFLGELEILKKVYPDCKYKLVVYHAVNQEGLDKVCSAFDEVIITNSYKDYESKGNLTVIDVTEG